MAAGAEAKILFLALITLAIANCQDENSGNFQGQVDKSTSVTSEAAAPRPRSKRKTDRLTAYACEDTTLNITCGQDLYLDVIRANYGRFSITICNDHGNTDWKVDCQAGRTLRAMQARCSNKNQCIVPVQSSIFGDPCPGTFKYIEVHYACRADPVLPKTTTSRPLPHWFPPASPRPGDWTSINLNGLKNETSLSVSNTTTIQPIVLTTLDPEDYEDESNIPGLFDGDYDRVIQVKVPKVPYNFEAIQKQQSKSHLPIHLPEENTTEGPDASTPPSTTTTKRPSVSLQVLANFTQYCPPARSRSLFWNWTLAGDSAVVQCPSGSTGFAKWSCDLPSPNGDHQRVTWDSRGPIFAECRSLWLGELDSKLRGGLASVREVGQILAEKTAQIHPDTGNLLFGGDLVLGARMLKHMAERMHYDLQRTVNLEAREAMVTDLVQNVVKTASNLISDSSFTRQSWSDLSPDELGRAATALLVGLEENAFLLAETVTSEKIIIKPTDNVLLSIRVMQSRNAHKQVFPSVETIESWPSTIGDSIELSPQAILQNGNNGAIRVIFTAFNQLDQLLIPIKTRHAAAEAGGKVESRKFINSRIIAASLGRGRHIELPQPVQITFRHLNDVDPARVRPECVYWDYVSNAWSSEGCQPVLSNVTHTQCSCNHLTNFALLMSQVGQNGHSATLDNPPKMAPSSKKSELGANSYISTIVVSVAALIVLAVIMFFVIYAWKRFQVSSQCRSALEKSGLPCFHKGKELPGSDKDKGNNKGNFYTVTPKLNANGQNQLNSSSNDEVAEAQQFFEHMINLQKNEQSAISRSMTLKRLNNEVSEASENKPNNLDNKIYPKRRALSPYNHIYMEIEPKSEQMDMAQQQPVYEPLTHSETYLMSTMSDLSEDNYNYLTNCTPATTDVSRQSSSREITRPLIRTLPQNSNPGNSANLLQTISGVLHSQSVRIAPSSARAQTLHYPTMRRNNELIKLNFAADPTYIASTTSDLGQQQPPQLPIQNHINGAATMMASSTSFQMTNAYLGKHKQFLRQNSTPNTGAVMMQMTPMMAQQNQFASEI